MARPKATERAEPNGNNDSHMEMIEMGPDNMFDEAAQQSWIAECEAAEQALWNRLTQLTETSRILLNVAGLNLPKGPVVNLLMDEMRHSLEQLTQIMATRHKLQGIRRDHKQI